MLLSILDVCWVPGYAFAVWHNIQNIQKQLLEVFYKKAVSKNFEIFTPGLEFFLIKLQAWRTKTLLKKETLTQVICCQYCEIFKSTYFEELGGSIKVSSINKWGVLIKWGSDKNILIPIKTVFSIFKHL